MKKTIFSLCGAAFFSLAVASSNNAPKPMDAANMSVKADSVFNAHKQAITDSMGTVCMTAGADRAKAVCDSVCMEKMSGK